MVSGRPRALTMSNATGIDTSPPKCNLCTARTSSSCPSAAAPVHLRAEHAQRHPAHSAGGRAAEWGLLTSLYEEAARRRAHVSGQMFCNDPNNEHGGCGACSAAPSADQRAVRLRRTWTRRRPVLPPLPAPQVSVRGFKNIQWTAESLADAPHHLPCARLSTPSPTARLEAIASYVAGYEHPRGVQLLDLAGGAARVAQGAARARPTERTGGRASGARHPMPHRHRPAPAAPRAPAGALPAPRAAQPVTDTCACGRRAGSRSRR